MDYVKFLRWSVISGLVLSLLIPFIVADGGSSWATFPLTYIPFSSMFFPYITGKNFAFRIIVEILIGLYVLLAIRNPKYRPCASWLLWATGGFALWMGLATVFGADAAKSFWGNFERMDGYITILHLFAYFVIAGAVLTAEKWWKRFFQISVGVSVFEGLIAIAQVFHFFGLSPSSQSGVRADGTFGNATYLAVYMLFNLFIALFLVAGVLKEKNAFRRYRFLLSFYVAAILLQFSALFLTETRGAILGLFAGLVIAAVYIAIFGRSVEYKTIRRVAFGVLGTLVILGGLFFALKDTALIRNTPGLARLASISLEDRTTISRFIIWGMALQGAMERPITGWGQENFNFVFNKYYSPDMYNQEQWFDRAHNEFLDWLVAGGIPALMFYISLFLLALFAVFRAKEFSVPEQAALFGIFAAYTVNNLVVFDNLVSLMYFYLLLAFAHSISRKSLPGFISLSKPGSNEAVAIAAPIVLVLVIGSIWVFNVPGISRAQTLIEGLQTNNPKTGAALTVEERLSAFEKSLSYGELGRQETVEQILQFASSVIAPSTSVNPATKEKAYALGHEAGTALTTTREGDARLELFMAVFYSQFGMYDEALVEFNKALLHSPNKQQILFQLGIVYLQRGDTQNALIHLKKAYDLAPEYLEAVALYATGLYYAGQQSVADQLIIERFGTLYPDDDRLLQAYLNTQQFERAIGIWSARVEKNPQNIDTLLGLASAYFAAGNLVETINVLRHIGDTNPSAKAEMDNIISQIQDGTLLPP